MPALGTARQTARPYLMTTACAGTFAFGTLVAFLGATLPELRTRIGFDIQQSGTLISLLFLPQVPMSFIAGPLIDRFGKKPVLASGSLLCAVVLATISVVHSYQVLAMLVFVLGAGASCINFFSELSAFTTVRASNQCPRLINVMIAADSMK